MKRTYLKGCEWCGSVGYTQYRLTDPQKSTSAITNVCPVCQGSGNVVVTEED